MHYIQAFKIILHMQIIKVTKFNQPRQSGIFGNQLPISLQVVSMDVTPLDIGSPSGHVTLTVVPGRVRLELMLCSTITGHEMAAAADNNNVLALSRMLQRFLESSGVF